MSTVETDFKVPRLKCLICRRWRDEYSSKYNYNEFFRVRKGSRMEKWIERFCYRTITEPDDERFICETHFNRLDILRIGPWNEKPLRVALLTDRNVLPIYFNQVSVRKWNTITDFKDIREHYKRCLSSYHWDIEVSHKKLVMKCKKNKNSIEVMCSLYVHMYCGGKEVESIKIQLHFLEGGKIKYWTRLRGLMRYFETHDKLVRNS